MFLSNKLLIVSGYIDSRPTGGVTMHVHRLLKLLVEPKVSDYELCDYKKEGFLQQLKKLRKADVAHIHASNPYLKLFYAIGGRILRTKTLITVHGRYGSFNWWNNKVHKLALRVCDVPILINRESYEEVIAFNKDAVYIPAFLPPIREEEELSPEKKEQIENIKSNGRQLFLTNASNRAFTDDGKEIYGIDFLIKFFSNHLEYNLLILDPKMQYLPIYEGKLPSNISIITGQHSFCGAVELSDIVIRNTPIDGDSFSVKEALYYHKPVLATDAVSRPKGAFLYKYNNAVSFEKAIEKAIAFNGRIEVKCENAVEEYLQLYCQFGIC